MFAKEKIEILQKVDARKEPVTEKPAWELLRKAGEIVVGRGKKYLCFNPTAENKEEILAQCLGRTGNLRAPALKVGKRYIIGFSEDMYSKYLGS